MRKFKIKVNTLIMLRYIHVESDREPMENAYQMRFTLMDDDDKEYDTYLLFNDLSAQDILDAVHVYPKRLSFFDILFQRYNPHIRWFNKVCPSIFHRFRRIDPLPLQKLLNTISYNFSQQMKLIDPWYIEYGIIDDKLLDLYDIDLFYVSKPGEKLPYYDAFSLHRLYDVVDLPEWSDRCHHYVLYNVLNFHLEEWGYKSPQGWEDERVISFHNPYYEYYKSQSSLLAKKSWVGK